MGRMLEALRRTEEPKPVAEPESGGVATEPVAQEFAEQEMPFIEVGGPRKAGDAKPRLELPAPRAAALEQRTPQGVALQSCPLPVAPRSRVAAEVVTFHQPEHPVSQQYAALFAQIATETGDGLADVVILTSLAPGIGTTTAVLNIAVAGCRQQRKRIVIVDANLRRPAVAGRLGVSETAGLAEVLRGQMALEKAVHATPVENLHILSAGTNPETAQASTDAFRWIVGWLRERFDLVLIDAPSWEKNGSLQALIPAAGTVYLVVDANETAQPAIRAATRELARVGGRVGGLIVTK